VLLLPPTRHNADFHVAAPIRQDNPTYPPLAKRLQVTGTVRIDAFVGKDGRAHSLKVVSGDPRLSSATLAAVSNWTFRPAQLDGESVESEVTISVNFDLH
jgi:TonB family protein